MSTRVWSSAPSALAFLLVTAAGCGRIGVDLLPSEQAQTQGGASGLGGAGGTGGEETGGTAASGGIAGAGGTAVTGGTAGTGGGVVTGGMAGAGAVGPSGAGGAGGIMGPGGAAGAGGAPPYQCTPGAPEVCDGRDNNCDTQIDEDTACPRQCSGDEFGGHGYMLCDQHNYTWDDGRIACEAQGMHLAVLDSQAEYDFAYAWAFATATFWVWIDGTDDATEGEWYRHDGTQFWTGGPTGNAVGNAFTAWMPGDPDNDGPGSPGFADCMLLTPDGWQDDGCGSFRRALCETY